MMNDFNGGTTDDEIISHVQLGSLASAAAAEC